MIIIRHLSNSYLGKLFDKYLVINCNHPILRIRHISTGLWIEISIKIPNTLNSDHLRVIGINTLHYQYIGFLFRALLYICGNDSCSQGELGSIARYSLLYLFFKQRQRIHRESLAEVFEEFLKWLHNFKKGITHTINDLEIADPFTKVNIQTQNSINAWTSSNFWDSQNFDNEKDRYY